jgi:hypothetical protein
MNLKRTVGTLILTGAVGTIGCSAGDSEVASGAEAVSTMSKIEHVVVIVQENHTFDTYFGHYCQAKAGSNPSCTSGPKCCEAAPETITAHFSGPAILGGGDTPILPVRLTDNSNTVYGADRNHDSACEYLEMTCGGSPDDTTAKLGADGADSPSVTCSMDRFVDDSLGKLAALGDKLTGGDGEGGGGASCGSVLGNRIENITADNKLGRSASNWAVASPDDVVSTYRDLARQGAIGDRYFQPTVGQTSSNDMFLATAQFEFRDNTWFPDTAGSKCQAAALPKDHQPNYHVIKGRKTIADLLLAKIGKDGFGYYHMGYGAMTDPHADKDDNGCPTTLPDLCPGVIKSLRPIPGVPDARVACMNDPSDNPFRYFEQFGDHGKNVGALHDYDQLAKDVAAGTLPAVSYVKAVTAVDEHPAFGQLSVGQAFVKQTVDAVLGDPKYKDNTLVLVTWDEGGGFYDHVSPPVVWDPHGAVDGTTGLHTNSETAGPGAMRLGTRVPVIALGKFARKNEVSHVQMEHSSIVKFLEWNYLGGKTGQLAGRESQVNNIGSLLDPALKVPEGDAVPHQP